MKKVAALRGATKTENTEADITLQLGILYDELLNANDLTAEDVISIIFSVSQDITAKNPAAALRASGRAGETALFSTLEPPIPPARPGMIRVLLHCNLEDYRKPQHIYRNGAECLRPDWSGTQAV